MQEVGFQNIETFGDFKETYREAEPDFLCILPRKNICNLRKILKYGF